MTKYRWIALVMAVVLLMTAVGAATATITNQEPEPQMDTSEQTSLIYGDYFVGVVELNEEAAIALESQVGDLQGWIEGIVGKRAEDAMQECIIRILQDKENTYLTKTQKDDFGKACNDRGIYYIDYDSIPDDLKASLLKQAKLN